MKYDEVMATGAGMLMITLSINELYRYWRYKRYGEKRIHGIIKFGTMIVQFIQGEHAAKKYEKDYLGDWLKYHGRNSLLFAIVNSILGIGLLYLVASGR